MKNQIKEEKARFSGIYEKWPLMSADYHRCAHVISATNAFVEPKTRKSVKNLLVRRIAIILDSSQYVEGDFRRISSCETEEAGTDFFGPRPTNQRSWRDSNPRPSA